MTGRIAFKRQFDFFDLARPNGNEGEPNGSNGRFVRVRPTLFTPVRRYAFRRTELAFVRGPDVNAPLDRRIRSHGAERARRNRREDDIGSAAGEKSLVVVSRLRSDRTFTRRRHESSPSAVRAP